jgi:hypothetical protein
LMKRGGAGGRPVGCTIKGRVRGFPGIPLSRRLSFSRLLCCLWH